MDVGTVHFHYVNQSKLKHAMAHLQDTSRPSIIGESGSETKDLLQLERILGKHDKTGAISKQVDKHMHTDGVSLNDLCYFDDVSLQEMIDSWNINTFDVKRCLIRGLLIKGIKNLSQTVPVANINGNNRDHDHDDYVRSSQPGPVIKKQHNINQDTPTIVSENEMKMIQLLTSNEHKLVNKIVSGEKNYQINKTKRKETLLKHEKEISNQFDELISVINKRKNVLLKQLNQNIQQLDNQELNLIEKLKNIKSEIDKTRNEYKLNLIKYNKFEDLQMRSEINCQLIETMINKNNLTSICEDKNDNCCYSYKFKIDLDKIQGVKISIKELGTMVNPANSIDISTPNTSASDIKTRNKESLSDICGISQNAAPDKVINEKQFLLKGGIIHNFGNLTIEKDCTLTVSKWTSKHPKHGGVLIICCQTLTLKNGASINVNGKGLPGGKKRGYQGYSFKLKNTSSQESSMKINDNNNINNDNSLESDCKQRGRYDSVSISSRSSNTNNSIDSYSFLNCDSNSTSISTSTSTSTSRKNVKISCPMVSNNSNYGGGGGGNNISAFVIGAGGGGGYGTCGKSDCGVGSGKGGESYGDAQLSCINIDLNGQINVNSNNNNNNNNNPNNFECLLGSGGGGCFEFCGTNGGGAIIIICNQSIIINKHGTICANGDNIYDLKNKWSGCGSGGTIYLYAPKLINHGSIMAVGGKNIANKKNGAKSGIGGMGRIRIDCNQQYCKQFQQNTNSQSLFGSLWKSNSNQGVVKPGVGHLTVLPS